MLSICLLCFVSACYASPAAAEQIDEKRCVESEIQVAEVEDHDAMLEQQKLKVNKEMHIGYKNDLSEPMWVKFECDQQFIQSETDKWMASLAAEYMGFKAKAGFTKEKAKQFMYKIMKRNAFDMTVVQPKEFYNEAVPKGCKAHGVVYVSITNFGTDGEPTAFMNSSSQKLGTQVIVSGSPDKPRIKTDATVCFGEKCGCKHRTGNLKGCWKECHIAGKAWGKCWTNKNSGGSSTDNAICNEPEDCHSDFKCGTTCASKLK